MKKTITIYRSPVGALTLCEEDGALTGLSFGDESAQMLAGGAQQGETTLLAEAARQLDEYFAGTRCVFDLPLHAAGTPFQQEVWAALATIPYGETRTYGEVAAQIGRPQAARAVGGANNKNPIALVVPCHRVVGSSGALTGFAAGLDIKRALLDLEQG